MNTQLDLNYEALGLKTVEALQKNRFNASFYKTAQEALEKLFSMVTPEDSVGIAGSWTLQQLGVVETLEERGNTVFCHHKPGLSPEEVLETRRKQLTCDVFLTGTNAITIDGRLVNTDATGNRVAAMIFGPKKVIVIAGVNKIVQSLEEAEERIRATAAPLNNKRLNRSNPCVQTGKCMDCQGPTRLCNVTTVLHKRPPASDIHILLVEEELGF
ncbi:lactate utilization protein [Geosporobacter ferrireducens]|uniref:Lactate utilization protein C n=1 Tax=Geosporobacter ferrireducens TaxID=1424294 RepID=A0A1D8GHC8_9FIRM|nr:lactate utilization protein [Geosporobacter ferrireducens]AOT70335.1 lactate utilization protein C [Geosporobacter ferrireducens]MTI54304.1 lactate utilization protein [Geosporobacter ferrireducens]